MEYLNHFLPISRMGRSGLRIRIRSNALHQQRNDEISEKCSLCIHDLIMHTLDGAVFHGNLEKYLTKSTYPLTTVTCDAMLYV